LNRETSAKHSCLDLRGRAKDICLGAAKSRLFFHVFKTIRHSGRLYGRAYFLRCRGVPGLASSGAATIIHRASRWRLRTWLASRPLGRLPAQLGCMAPLLFPANALGPSPILPLVNGSEIGKPRVTQGFP
jgi:hypothetical protein